jgi:hypothetical protein
LLRAIDLSNLLNEAVTTATSYVSFNVTRIAKVLEFMTMKERPIGQKEKDDKTLDFVNYQAQEAILNPDLPDSYKDQMLSFALGTIKRIAERRIAYKARHVVGRRTRRPK